MKTRPGIPALALTALLASLTIIVFLPGELKAETILEADKLKIAGETTVAEGNVRLSRSNWSLSLDYLKLDGGNEREEIEGRGNVKLVSGESTIKAGRLTGKLTKEGSGKSIKLTFFRGSGESGSVKFGGQKIELVIKKGELDHLNIISDAELSKDGDASIKAGEILLANTEAGWRFESTGSPEYKTDSTTLRSERIRGTVLEEAETGSREIESNPERAVAEGKVQLSWADWTLDSDYLELTRWENETKEIAARGNVELSSGDFTVSSDRLSGRLTGENRSDRVELTLLKARGKSDSVDFAGKTVELEASGGSVVDLQIEEEANLSPGEDYSFSGDRASAKKVEGGWNFEVSGEAQFTGKTTSLQGNMIRGSVSTGENKDPRLSNLTAENLSGKVELESSGGEKTIFQVGGKSASLDFEDSTTLSGADFYSGSFSSCERCRCPGGCAYSISADRTSLIESDVVLARSASLKSFGLPIGWSPLYFISLKDVGLPERPYFPRIGYSSREGISFSGAFPVFVDVDHFGNVVLDYFSRSQGFGLGLDYYSGGNTLTGVGEIYGIYRLFGDSSFKIDGKLDFRPTEWVLMEGNAEIMQGLLGGTNYDRNEWSLSLSGRRIEPDLKALVEREENEDESETTHVIERMPEFSASWENQISDFPLKYGLRSSLGYYREHKDVWDSARSGAKGNLGADFRLTTSPFEPLDLSLTGEVRANPYYEMDNGGLTNRTWWSAEPALKIDGPGTFEVRFTHQNRAGKSLFDFDSVERLDRLSFDYGSSQSGIDQSLRFHYDFTPDEGFSEVQYEVSLERASIEQKFGLNYDISTASLSSFTSDSTYSGKLFELSLSSGYDFGGGSISETTLGFQTSSEKNNLDIELTGNPFQKWLKEVSGELNLELFENWSLSLKGKYDIQSGSLTSLSYSLYNTLQNCLKVGITGTESGFWFDVELVDF